MTVYSDLAMLGSHHYVLAVRQCDKWEGYPRCMSFKAVLIGR